jgi:heme exporter protein D
MLSGGIYTWSEFRGIVRCGMLVIAALLLASTARLAILSDFHFRQAREEQQRGEMQAALQAYTWSIRNDFPGNPYTRKAVAGALEIIETYHSQGKKSEEIVGLREVQAALSAVRSFYQPCKDTLPIIEERLNRVSTK